MGSGRFIIAPRPCPWDRSGRSVARCRPVASCQCHGGVFCGTQTLSGCAFSFSSDGSCQTSDALTASASVTGWSPLVFSCRLDVAPIHCHGAVCHGNGVLYDQMIEHCVSGTQLPTGVQWSGERRVAAVHRALPNNGFLLLGGYGLPSCKRRMHNDAAMQRQTVKTVASELWATHCLIVPRRNAWLIRAPGRRVRLEEGAPGPLRDWNRAATFRVNTSAEDRHAGRTSHTPCSLFG